MKSADVSSDITSNDNWIGNLFLNLLNEVYCSEKALAKIMPRLIDVAVSEDVVDALVIDLEASNKHVLRLDEIFVLIGKKMEINKCRSLMTLIKEIDLILESANSGGILDSSIVFMGQKVKEYEMETYRTLCSLAKTLNEPLVTTLLENTLDEEMQGNSKFKKMSELLLRSKIPGEMEYV